MGNDAVRISRNNIIAFRERNREALFEKSNTVSITLSTPLGNVEIKELEGDQKIIRFPLVLNLFVDEVRKFDVIFMPDSDKGIVCQETLLSSSKNSFSQYPQYGSALAAYSLAIKDAKFPEDFRNEDIAYY